MARSSYIGKVVSSAVGSLRRITSKIYGQWTEEDDQIAPPGIDSVPIPGDRIAAFTVDDSGNAAVAGVYTKPSTELEPGEIMIYSRDSSGELKAAAIFKSEGAVEIKIEDGPDIAFDEENLVVTYGDTTVDINEDDIILDFGDDKKFTFEKGEMEIQNGNKKFTFDGDGLTLSNNMDVKIKPLNYSIITTGHLTAFGSTIQALPNLYAPIPPTP